MTTITTSDFIYIGNFADMDTSEGDQDTENPGLVLGVHDDLSIVTLTQVDGDDDGVINDDEVGNSGDYVNYDVGNGATSQWVDSTSAYNAIITLGDGSQLSLEVLVVQTQAGDVFVSDLLSSTELDGRAIQSVNLTSLQTSDSTGYFTNQGVSGASTVCFAEGTRILGRDGSFKVEDIEPGNLIRTLDHGLQPVWDVVRTHLPYPGHNAPICIATDALAPGVPNAPLCVSPQHRLLISSRVAQNMTGVFDVLVAAMHLRGLRGVSQKLPFLPVRYFHLLFERHELVLANGTVSESLFLGSEALKSNAASDRSGGEMRPVRPFVQGKQARKLISRHQANRAPLHEPLARNASQSLTMV